MEDLSKLNINWYPGHMAKTKRLISEQINLIDIVYEVIDARMPLSSKIIDIEEYTKNKPKILIVSKTDLCDKKEAREASSKISETLPWAFNKELVGAIELYKDKVDGIILMSSFPCGPDSLVNEIILRRVKGIPILNLVLDGQEGSAGLETRLESFVDIIKIKKEDQHGKM